MEAEDERDVVEESRSHILALIEEGWGVWDRADPSADALALYPPDDDGFELALEHFRRVSRTAATREGSRLDVLLRVAIVSGVLWIVSSGLTGLVFAIQWPRSPSGFDAIYAWGQAVERIAYPLFITAVGLYVVIWLRDRPDWQRVRPGSG